MKPNIFKYLNKNPPAKPSSGKSKPPPPPPIEFPKTLNTNLGNRGYSIIKSELTDSQVENLKKMLMAKPVVMGGVMYIGAGDQEFPIYRESSKKIYMPRYFGETHFGPAKEVTLPEGVDISLEFAGGLRENQIPVVNAYMEKVGALQNGGGLLELECAAGKTVLSLYLISQLKKKTLVIVNKEFLLNQWIERISQFLPNARVGRIQGQVIDIENKDIVIGMLQSLSMKDYPTSTFESFGVTIIDEVHHISSEVFSCALFKIVTKYMIGLSATMERKDGTTYVFKMFLGEVVYKSIRQEEHSVKVRGIEFKTADEDFNSVEYDFRGNPQFSKMISKLCDYHRRSDFIVRVVADLIEENPDKQIMVIGHNRSLLEYLYDAITHSNIASVGYYVGGMKQQALQESESKKIILASYAMAQEGLDIKTLSTLVMITPKTDIIQTVGRILRVKHSTPIIVDIIDSHEPFQNQWKKRRAYYKKCNYSIKMTDSNKYKNMLDMDNSGIWKTVNTPTSSACSAKSAASNTTHSDESSGSDVETSAVTKGNRPKVGRCLVDFGFIEQG